MNLFKGLMFLHGHFTRPEDLYDDEARLEYGARTAAEDFAPPLGNRAASAAWWARAIGRPPSASRREHGTRRDIAPPPAQAAPARMRAGFSLFEDLLFLGGRPMHAGHNDDIDEPLPQLVDDATPAKPAARTRSVAVAACSIALSPFR